VIWELHALVMFEFLLLPLNSHISLQLHEGPEVARIASWSLELCSFSLPVDGLPCLPFGELVNNVEHIVC
jgi:hypothetical protein